MNLIKLISYPHSLFLITSAKPDPLPGSSFERSFAAASFDRTRPPVFQLNTVSDPVLSLKLIMILRMFGPGWIGAAVDDDRSDSALSTIQFDAGNKS